MKIIRPESFIVCDAPVYGNIRFTYSSQKDLMLFEAFEFPRKQGGRLQSIGHAVVARVGLYNDNKESHQGLDFSDEYQRTSTISLKFIDNQKIVMAFVELDDNQETLALVNEGHYADFYGQGLFKSLDDSLVSRLVQSARERNRICPALTTNTPLKLSTVNEKNKSEYEQNEIIIAAFGSQEIAELNARYLQERGFNHIFISDDHTADEFENNHKGKENHALIRPVRLGTEVDDGFHHYIDDVVYDYCSFCDKGWARGVVDST